MNSKKKKILSIAALLLVVVITVATKGFGGLKDLFGETETEWTTDGPSVTTSQKQDSDSTGEDTTVTEAPDTTQPHQTEAKTDETEEPAETTSALPDKNGYYYSKDDVVLYLRTYGKLPPNFITKDEAEDLGWSGNGNDKIEKYKKGGAIGGDYFGNYEGLLPKKSGRKYYECDIDTYNAVRGKKRIIFSNDGLIYYTSDHYSSFTLISGEP